MLRNMPAPKLLSYVNMYRLPNKIPILQGGHCFRNNLCAFFMLQITNLPPLYFLAMFVWALHSPKCKPIRFSYIQAIVG
jgi:hypothetical protein